MARHPLIAGIALLLLAVVAAGCTSPSQQAEGPAPGVTDVTDVGINVSPGSGSDVVEEATDQEGEAESDTDKNKDDDDADAGKGAAEPGALACDLKHYAYGTVGKPFSLMLAATGGSGSYRFALAAGQSLPEGLALNQATSTLEGTPAKAGSFQITFAVTDLKEDATRNCSPLKLTIAPQEIKVQDLGGFTPPPQLERGEQTVTLPPARITQLAFGTMGGELMQQEEYDGFKLSLMICANAEMTDRCTAFNGDQLQGIKRGRWTSAIFDLPEEITGFKIENGNPKHATFSIGPEHRYVRITQVGKTGPYDVKAVHFALLTERGAVYTYFNPCLEKRLYKKDSLLFGPDDTAICAVISTGDAERAGTFAPVELLLRLPKGVNKAGYKSLYANNLLRSQRLGKNFLHAMDSPHFSEVLELKANDGTQLSYLVLQLEWRQLTDDDTGATYEFWNRRTVAFGDYLDFNPFSMSLSDHNVRLRTRPNDVAAPFCSDLLNQCIKSDVNIIMKLLYEEESKDWLLKGYQVYLFFPGKVNDREAMRLLRAVEEREQWILAKGATAPDGKTGADVVIEKGKIYTMPTIPYKEITSPEQIGKILFEEMLPLRW